VQIDEVLQNTLGLLTALKSYDSVWFDVKEKHVVLVRPRGGNSRRPNA